MKLQMMITCMQNVSIRKGNLQQLDKWNHIGIIDSASEILDIHIENIPRRKSRLKLSYKIHVFIARLYNKCYRIYRLDEDPRTYAIAFT